MLVGICGQAGSGKDTVADFLCQHHSFVKVAFAVARLLLLEYHYKTGYMAQDWELKREGNDLFLSIFPSKPVEFIRFNLTTESAWA